LEHLDHPVMGDPRYGELNKNRSGLALAAVELVFLHPVSGRPVCIKCPEGLLPESLRLSAGGCP
jgi:23S rRNA-/tRNA-specific pseudouridylate synthase